MVKRRSRKTRNTRKRLNRSSKRVRKKKYSKRKKSKYMRRGAAAGGVVAGGMMPQAHVFILDRIIRREMSKELIRQYGSIWDIISSCNAPLQLYQELERIGIPEINRRFEDSCREGRPGPTCGIFKLEEEMMDKKWWIKSGSGRDRLLLRKIIGDFIIDKGLDGIYMPEFHAVMVEKNPDRDEGRPGGSHEIGSLRNDLTKDEYVSHRLVKHDDSVWAEFHAMDDTYPGSVVEGIARIKNEGVPLPDRPGFWRWADGVSSDVYGIQNGEVFWVDTYTSQYAIYLLLEHVPTAVKMCDTYVGLHIMYLINVFPLDLGNNKAGVNFSVTEEGTCSIIDCEIKGDTSTDDFFDKFSMRSGAANFEEHVRTEDSFKTFTEESLRGGVPCMRNGRIECTSVPYYYDKGKIGLFYLYYLLLTGKLTIENVRDYRMDEKRFTIEDVTELKTILSGDHFARCEIPHQFKILDKLLSL